MAVGFGVAGYFLTQPQLVAEALESSGSEPSLAPISVEFIFFSILGFSFLLWATIPLSTGSSRQFDPGNLLMYPISLKKLFALDLISELTTIQSIFAVPALLALGIGAGLGSGKLVMGLVAGAMSAMFGLALTKWLSVAIGSLTKRRRTSGETLIAIIGAVVGFGGALIGQIAPLVLKHAEYVKLLRWTPPGAAAYTLTSGLSQSFWTYLLALFALAVYTSLLVFASYVFARRLALGMGGGRRAAKAQVEQQVEAYAGWRFPLASTQLSAILEKEFRYVMRNAQLRMMALMPLILIVLRLVNSRHFGNASQVGGGASPISSEFFLYGQGLIAAGGVLYVFLILSGLSCNLFAFEEGGMRALILAPVERRKILLGKNIVVITVALLLSLALLGINQLIFSDLSVPALIFTVMSFVIYGSLMSVIGNWFSIRFPKRMKMGKRMNVSGVVGLLLIPLIAILALPPLAAVAAGYLTQSLLIEYVTLSLLAVICLGLYVLVIGSQGELLARREVEVLETVREHDDD